MIRPLGFNVLPIVLWVTSIVYISVMNCLSISVRYSLYNFVRKCPYICCGVLPIYCCEMLSILLRAVYCWGHYLYWWRYYLYCCGVLPILLGVLPILPIFLGALLIILLGAWLILLQGITFDIVWALPILLRGIKYISVGYCLYCWGHYLYCLYIAVGYYLYCWGHYLYSLGYYLYCWGYSIYCWEHYLYCLYIAWGITYIAGVITHIAGDITYIAGGITYIAWGIAFILLRVLPVLPIYCWEYYPYCCGVLPRLLGVTLYIVKQLFENHWLTVITPHNGLVMFGRWPYWFPSYFRSHKLKPKTRRITSVWEEGALGFTNSPRFVLLHIWFWSGLLGKPFPRLRTGVVHFRGIVITCTVSNNYMY